MNKDRMKDIAIIAGFVSGLHDQLWKIREEADSIEERDIDSAQVYLEAVHWKLLQILERGELSEGDGNW